MENKKIEKNSGSVESNDNGNDSSFDFSDMEEPDRIGDIERGETLKVEENEEKNLNNEDENIERRKSKTSVKLPPIITGNKNPSTVDKERDVRLEKIEKLSFKEEMDSKTKETNPKGNGSSKNYGSSNKFQSEEEEEKKEVTPKRKRETPRASETPAKDLPNRREQSRVVQQQKRMQARHRNAEILQARRAAGRQNRGRNLRHRRRASQSSPGEEEQQGDNKEEKIQVFIERDSHTSFCQFLSSGKYPILKFRIRIRKEEMLHLGNPALLLGPVSLLFLRAHQVLYQRLQAYNRVRLALDFLLLHSNHIQVRVLHLHAARNLRQH